MTKIQILEYLKSKKSELATKYGITTIGLYGSYARDEANENSDIDIFYDSNENFNMGYLEFSEFLRNLQNELNAPKIDFVRITSMNPIIKHYAKKDFIYV